MGPSGFDPSGSMHPNVHERMQNVSASGMRGDHVGLRTRTDFGKRVRGAARHGRRDLRRIRRSRTYSFSLVPHLKITKTPSFLIPLKKILMPLLLDISLSTPYL